LGQYRSYLRNAAATTYTETNGAPTTAPTDANGIVIYRSTAWASADPSNQPSRYDIFIGKNKIVKVVFHKSAGRTGFADVSPTSDNNSIYFGFHQNYDPTTGVFTLAPALSGAAASSYAGRDDASANLSTAYFDIVVSENALAVGMQVPRCELRVDGENGYGSTNTKILKYSTKTTDRGTCFSSNFASTMSTTDGLAVTILEDGVYGGTATKSTSGAAGHVGITRNSAQLTTSIASCTATDVLGIGRSDTGGASTGASFVKLLSAGDVIRPHADAVATSGFVGSFTITKVSN